MKWMKQWMGMLPSFGFITLWLQPIFLLVLFIWNAKITENSAQFFLFWVIEVKCIPRADGEEVLKKKEVFVHNIYIHKNLSQFCNSFYRLRDSNSSLWPIFQGLNYLIVSCFSHTFIAHISIN